MYELALHRKQQVQRLCQNVESSKRYSKMTRAWETCRSKSTNRLILSVNQQLVDHHLYLIHDSMTSQEMKIAKDYRVLWINVEELDQEKLTFLKEFHGQILILSLDHLNQEQAQSLSQLKLETLLIHTKSLVLPKTAEKLAYFKGRELAYSSQQKLSSQVMKALNEFKGNKLQLQINGDLSVEDAQTLSEFKGYYLSLYGLKKLSIDLANAFKESRFRMILDDLEDYETEALSRLRTRLDYASWYTAEPFTMLMIGKTQIDSKWLDQIESLRLKTDNYVLNGLKELSLDLINKLIERKPKQLVFNGLESLSQEAAQALAQYPRLNVLDGSHQKEYRLSLSSLSPNHNVLSEVVKTRANTLELGFKTLDQQQAKILSQYRGDLFLPHLQTIDASLLKVLFSTRLHGLSLSGVEAIDYETDQQINTITNGQRKVIKLDHLRKKDKASYKARFAQSPLATFFSDSEQITIELAKYFIDGLSENKPTVINFFYTDKINVNTAKLINKFGDLTEISLPVLREIDAASLNELLTAPKLKNISLGIEILTPELAKILSVKKLNSINFTNLKTIESKSAQYMSQFTGEVLNFQHLSYLNAESARALSQFKGNLLQLNDIIHLSIDAATELAKAQVQIIELKNLRYLDDASIKQLATFKGKKIIIDHRDHWSKEQQKLFRNSPIKQY